ncbi:MAG: phage baseplate assembly protein V [Litorimonas sp.]
MESRAAHNLVFVAQIDTLSDDGLSAVLRIGDILTDPRPLPAVYGRNFTAAFAVHPGAQVLAVAPSGVLENAVVVAPFWKEGIAPWTTDPGTDGIRFEDGTTVAYDSTARFLTITTPGDVAIGAGGDVAVSADGVVTVVASQIALRAADALILESPSIRLIGPTEQTGGDLTSDGVSVQTHTHPETGTVTAVPQ